MRGTLGALRSLSGDRLPKWSPNLPKPVRFLGPPKVASREGDAVVYFPSCAARTMGPQRGDEAGEALPVVAERLFRKAGFEVVVPESAAGLCCGQPFESKGLFEAADRKSAELEEALRQASHGGRLPIVFDTSPCAYRMRRFCGERLPVLDAIEFIHDTVLARVAIEPRPGPVAIHPVCSVRKMGSAAKLAAIASRCSARVVTVPDVLCCGFAGDKGFHTPELNAHALRHLRPALPPECREGYSSSRTCEIGLSEKAGIAYRSILHLVEGCARSSGGVRGRTPN
jgi:D-lactate dehydrogenase